MSEKNDKTIENEVIKGQISVDEALSLEKSEEVEKEELTSIKEEKKTKGFKLTPTTISELAVLEGKFQSAEDLMKTLISIYRTQRVSEVGYEDRIKDVDQFNSLIESLRILFVSSVELEKTTTSRVSLEFRNKIESLTKSVSVLTEEKIKLTEELKQSLDVLGVVTSDNKDLISQLEAIQILVNNKEKELEQEREQVNTLTSLLNEFKGYKEVNSKLERVNKELERVNLEKENAIKNLNTDKLLLEKDINNLNKNINSLKKSVDEIKVDRQELIVEKQEYQKTVAKLQKELNLKNIEVSELKQDIKQVNREVDRFEKTVTELNEVISSKNNENNKLNESVSALMLEKENTNIAKLELNHQLKILNSEINQLTIKLTEAEEVKKELVEIKNENKKLLAELRVYDKQYEAHETRFFDKLVEKDEKIKQLEEEIAELNSKINQLDK